MSHRDRRCSPTVSRASPDLREAGYHQLPQSQPLRTDLRKGAKSVDPLAGRAISNLQQWLIGTYHGVSRDQLQVYLDEFVFRHNRRRQPMAAFQFKARNNEEIYE
jgi:hypothetical protein